MSWTRPTYQAGAYTVTTRHGRVYLVDQLPGSDPGMTPIEARRLAVALATAADKTDQQSDRLGAGTPPTPPQPVGSTSPPAQVSKGKADQAGGDHALKVHP